MKSRIAFSIFLIAALGLTGCMKRDCGCYPDRDGGHDGNHHGQYGQLPPVLFQYEYINYAWGFRHNGFFLDQDGRIVSFKQPEKWIFPDSTGLLTKADLQYNLAQCDSVFGRVNQRELDNNYDKIQDVRLGTILDNGLIMADAGTGVMSAWYWNDKLRSYENVFLMSNGDRSRVNTHPDVKGIVEFLKQAGKKTTRFNWFDGI